MYTRGKNSGHYWYRCQWCIFNKCASLKKLLTTIFYDFWRYGMFVYHMWSDFGGDPNHDVDTGILNAILPLLERGSCKNFRNQLPRRRFRSSKLMVQCFTLSRKWSSKAVADRFFFATGRTSVRAGLFVFISFASLREYRNICFYPRGIPANSARSPTLPFPCCSITSRKQLLFKRLRDFSH